MRVDVTDDLTALAEFLSASVDPVYKVGYRDGALWSLARVSGHDSAELSARLATIEAGVVTPPAVDTPPPAPTVSDVDRDSLRARAIAAAANPSPDSFGPPMLGLRVTRQATRPTATEPRPSFSADADEAREAGAEAAQPIPPEELAALVAAREAAARSEVES